MPPRGRGASAFLPGGIALLSCSGNGVVDAIGATAHRQYGMAAGTRWYEYSDFVLDRREWAFWTGSIF